MSWRINNTYGYPFGISAYSQPRVIGESALETLIDERAIVVKFLDKDGFFLHSFHSNTQAGFPVSKMNFSFLAGSPNQCNFTLLKHPEDYKFQLGYGDIVEIYIYDAHTPYWSGVITQSPTDVNEEKVFSFKAEGLKKRIESTFVNEVITTEISISDLVNKIVLDYLIPQVPQLKYDEEKIEPLTNGVNNLKLERTKGSSALKKIAKIAGNYEWGIDEERHFYFREKSIDIDPRHIYMAGVNVPAITIEEGDYSKIINKMFVEKKADSGSGTSYVDEVNQLTSQALYGVYSKTLQVPEAVSHNEALVYGTNMVELNAFPSHKCKITGLPFFNTLKKFSDKKLNKGGFARVFSEEKYSYETVDNCEVVANWNSSDNSKLAISEELNIIKEGEKSIHITSTGDSVDEYVQLDLPSAQDWDSVKELTFWVKSNRAGAYLQFGFGEISFSENLYDVYVGSTGQWQKISINIEGVSQRDEILKLGFKCVNADEDFSLYVDKIEKYGYGRKSYELEIKKVECNFEASKATINLDLGSIDFPFVSQFVEAWQGIEALKQASKGV